MEQPTTKLPRSPQPQPHLSLPQVPVQPPKPEQPPSRLAALGNLGKSRRTVSVLALGLLLLLAVGIQVQRMGVGQPAQAAMCVACGPASSGSNGGNVVLSNTTLAGDSIKQAANAASEQTPVATNADGTLPVPHLSSGIAAMPCHDTTIWVANITNWTTPPGCYGTIYTPDRSKYYSPTTFGYCNWWVEALHTKYPDILMNSKYARGDTPVVGAAMWFDPGVQGASSAGHWAQVVAIAPDHYWMLITEMNFSWRGGGFGKVDYRYVHVGPGTQYVYTPEQQP